MTHNAASPTTDGLSVSQRAALEVLLAAHAPADADEADSLARIRAFVAATPDPFARANHAGHVTGSAFIVDGQGRLLLIHHRKLGIWVQPGGHADAERLAHEVALREATEETGLPDLRFHPALRLPGGAPALLDVDVHTIPARPGEPAHEHFDLRFLLVTARPEGVAAAVEEVAELAWFDAAAIARIGDPGVVRAAGKVGRLSAR